jgi:hypothetical protein
MNKHIIFLVIFFCQQSCFGTESGFTNEVELPINTIMVAINADDLDTLKSLTKRYKNVCVMCNKKYEKGSTMPVHCIAPENGKKIDLQVQELVEVGDLEMASLKAITFNVHKDRCLNNFKGILSLMPKYQELCAYRIVAGVVIGALGIFAFIILMVEAVRVYEG